MKTRVMNEKGQFLIFVTLAFVLLGLFLGLAIDLGRGYLLKARLSRVVDAATLAAAKALKGQIAFQDEAVKAACEAMLMNGMKIAMKEDGTCGATGETNFILNVNFVNKVVSGGPPVRFVEITGTASIPTTFMRLAKLFASGNFDTLTVSAFAEGGPERPVDLMLILDRSGSMDSRDGTEEKKIIALKKAVDAFLKNAFSDDDRVGMVSFASRGCGKDGADSIVVGPCTPDKDLGSSISSIQSAVDALCGGGADNCGPGRTNTMEALRTAKGPIEAALSDLSRKTTRKAVLLVTDGQPTNMRRDNDDQCKRNPRNGNLLPSPGDGNAGGGPFTNGCKQGVGAGFDYMLRQPLNQGGSAGSLQIGDAVPGKALYQDVIRCTRSMANCVTNGALFEANEIRRLDADGDGVGDVVIFAIAIGKPEPDSPQSSLDANAKCLLARIANDPSTISECNNVFKTKDEDTHLDLKENWPCAGGPCIDETQQRGRVFTVDLTDVEEQLKAIFEQIAALLKLRLTI